MATHSIISTYFGSITIVLKFPLTNAASTNGLERNSGFGIAGTGNDGETAFEGIISVGEKAAEVGVVVLFGALWARVIDRLCDTNNEDSKLLSCC